MTYRPKKIIAPVMLGAVIIGLVGCSTSSHRHDASLVSGQDMNITKAEFSDHLVNTAQTKDMEDYILYRVLTEKYPVSVQEVTEAIAKEKQNLPRFAKEVSGLPISENKYSFNTTLRLMLEKGVKAQADVSEPTLKKYYENWEPERFVTVIQTDTETNGKKIRDKLAAGERINDLTEDPDMQEIIQYLQTIAYSDSTKIDEKIRSEANALSSQGDLKGPFKFGQSFIVLQLEDPGEKTSYDQDLSKMKDAYLNSQVTNFNKSKLVKELIQDKKFECKSKDFEGLFETYLLQDPHAPKSE